MSYFSTITLSIIAVLVVLVVSEITVNTPTGTLSTGALATITWVVNGVAPTIAGTLKIRNRATNEDTTIDGALDLSKLSKQWKVDVQPGQYLFVINDGSGEKFSGFFNVISGVPSGAPNPPNSSPASGSRPTKPTGSTTGSTTTFV
ncbi:12453_t:CDS:2 [Dentiscutata heterogama]|uniref:12453_t:CDS:1 n=1 Tax=Dentiscutata heterogama TaxID=1316150 RepID=A0ACA9LSD5_9GLOM|nr:12453_t:CDS:2 [Dentiscutata heterogama]